MGTQGTSFAQKEKQGTDEASETINNISVTTAESIVANTVSAESVVADTVAVELIVANTVSAESVVADTVVVEPIVANTVSAESVVADTEPKQVESVKSKAEIIVLLQTALDNKSVNALKRSVEELKTQFYKLHNTEIEALKQTFYTNNNHETEFIVPLDPLEAEMKKLLNQYKTKRDKYLAEAEAEKESNYKTKLKIIEELKELTNSSETLGNTFNMFRELQNRWKEIGLVPQNVVRDLWETYNLHTENFYNYIKINNELRDLDLKKNYEFKLELIEKVEALILEVSIINSFAKLQKLHDKWREIGPVSQEQKEIIWERFKIASTTINKKHQEYFDEIKEEQISNLKLKTNLCENVEVVIASTPMNRQEWENASQKAIEMQKVWKTIGFAPKKDNNAIYDRFRKTCDELFKAKQKFYEQIKLGFEDNYQTKLDLCIQVEDIAESTDWKQTTEQIIELQKKWKQSGATSRKQSTEVWNRFREACDKFFEARNKNFEATNEQYIKNLEEKENIIEQLKNIETKDINFDALKEYQKRWSDIGFVPIKEKDKIYKEYKEIIDNLFDTVRGSESNKRIDNYKERVVNFKDSDKTSSERGRLMSKMKSLESEILTLENNIGFFAHSKNAEALVKDVQHKIDRTREDIKEIVEKIKLIDNQ